MSGSPAPIGALAGFAILILEDDPFIAMDLEEVLMAAGAEILGPFATVRAALAEIERRRPDAAVLDVNLRGERSTPVVRALRAAGAPFLLVTGYARGHLDEPELRDAPRMTKPADPRKLVARLRALLEDCGES